MSLMGVVMLVGIAVSNSILIVEFTRHLREEGLGVREAVAKACRVRLRPVLMTSLATIIGLLPMALEARGGQRSYAPLARAILGGLSVSVALTIFLVPAMYVLVYGRSREVNASAASSSFCLLARLPSPSRTRFISRSRKPRSSLYKTTPASRLPNSRLRPLRRCLPNCAQRISRPSWAASPV